LELFIKVSVNS